MQVFSHVNRVYKDGATTQTGYVSYVRGVERWVSNYWGEDPLEAPPGICRAVCVASKPQRHTCFQRVQDDMSKAKSVGRDWEFVSKGTEISLGKFVSEYFTPLTLGLQTGVVSTEDTDEIWETVKEEAMEKTKGRKTRRARADSPMAVETEVEKSF
jgi:hypothetical protein